MEGIEVTGTAMFGAAEAFVVAMPESIGLLVFGVVLMLAAVMTRRYLRKAEDKGSAEISCK